MILGPFKKMTFFPPDPLLLGQCTQVLLNEMEQDTDWVVISRSVDPHLLFKLIRNIVLKQSDTQYKPLVVDVAEQECLSQEEEEKKGKT